MEYLQVSEAQRVVLETVATMGAEQVKLEQSLGRVLAEEVRANRDQPPFDISAMDGYALRSADLAGIPATLEIIEDIKAGDLPTKTLAPGQCARIMTGAPMPQGADAVIRVEDTEALAENRVQINQAVKSGNDIRRLGENMRNGEVVLGQTADGEGHARLPSLRDLKQAKAPVMFLVSSGRDTSFLPFGRHDRLLDIAAREFANFDVAYHASCVSGTEFLIFDFY